MFTMQNAKDERWTILTKFWEGHADGKALKDCKTYAGADGQAYDRGYEVGLNEPPHWGDDPNIGQTVGLN